MSWRAMEKVLVVGSGLTGAASACFLREACPEMSVVIWDKARGIGGRMSTSRSPKDSECTVDLGAQYITATPEYRQKHSRLYEDLLSMGILSPLAAKIEGDSSVNGTNYVTPQGSSSLVKYFIQKSGVQVMRDHQINSVSLGDKGQITVGTLSGVRDQFDGVLLTMPVPQILQLQGDIKSIIDKQSEVKRKLEAVRYSSRFCLGLFYKAGAKLGVPWSAKYIPDHDCLRFVSIDSRKRGRDEVTSAPSVVVHTSVPFGVNNLERDKEEIAPEIYDHFTKMFPEFPEPEHIKGHKWRYSQVSQGYEGSPGYLILQENPFIICGGDGFAHSKFDGCIDSTEAVVSAFIKQQKKLKADL
ncbi:renalase-like [Liolophura sinensis]|uniref:renalase-like n=1 Tax=Liolophura sinensis TaxID=3198878 RepID=UPI003159043A